MSFFSGLFSYERLYDQNSVNSVAEFITCLKVKITKTTIEKALTEHSDYPSLLSISDALNSFGIENIGIKTNIEKLHEIPAPFFVPVRSPTSHRDFFTIVQKVNDDTINYFDSEKSKWENIPKTDFEKKWPLKIALLADAENASNEKDYKKKRGEEIRKKIADISTYAALPLVAIVVSTWNVFKHGQSAVFPVLFLMLSLIGSIITILLLWYEIDEYNPLLQQICNEGKKVNCNAILHSKASKVVGISWSAIGFVYFAGGVMVQLFTGITNMQTLSILAWLNLFAAPYIIFSVYYQWLIAKQWCVLCLSVQALLAMQLVTGLLAGWPQQINAVMWGNNFLLITLILSYLLPFVVVNLLLPARRAAKEGKANKKELIRLKHNPQIFEALLGKQRDISKLPDKLGISLGNPNAPYKIIKVCNPYCGPCAKAHKPIEELLHDNPNVQVQIIFTATNEEGDIKAPPVKHLLAIAEKNDETKTKQALDDWYLADKKDYEVFAAKYPINGELKMQSEKLDAMQKWCEQTGIRFTPTFFITSIFSDDKGEKKFFQLPELYSVSDLKYFFLSVPETAGKEV
ncbi:MAG: thioredoxin domain-containing protein [Bacteroidetes bacterium]|nr:thioredoxin domain-containing protein [Bacteroidota bacterium]